MLTVCCLGGKYQGFDAEGGLESFLTDAYNTQILIGLLFSFVAGNPQVCGNSYRVRLIIGGGKLGNDNCFTVNVFKIESIATVRCRVYNNGGIFVFFVIVFVLLIFVAASNNDKASGI